MMSEVVGLFLLALTVVGLAALGWWLVIPTEGVYLGRRVVIWLYDRFAHRYDAVKNYDPYYERWLLAVPLMTAIEPLHSPLVLDVATGTGRLPRALADYEEFQGRVIGLDLSRPMLEHAARKLAGDAARVTLLWCPAENLPFDDHTFDVVTCLEALEFMTHPAAVLRELVRVLRPGGLLLVTNRVRTQLMPGKVWTETKIEALLKSDGMEHVTVETWQYDYQKVWALKAGDSLAAGARPLGEVLRCPRCRANLMVEQNGAWVCEGCQGRAQIGDDGVIELFPLYDK